MIWLVILPALAAVKVITQGWISRKKCVSIGDSLLLNAMICGASALVLLPIKYAGLPSVRILIPAVLLGVFSTAFQCFYLSAFRNGPVGLTTVINNFNLVFPILCGILVYHETLTVWRFIGIVLMVIPLILLPRGKKGTTNWKWLVLACAALVASGINNILLLIVSHSSFSTYESDMIVVIGFAVATVLSIFLSLFFKKDLPGKINLPTVGGVLICGIALGLYNCLTIVALKALPAIIVYPIVNVLVIALITWSDSWIYHEKMNKKQFIGFLFAIAAIALMNM